MLFRSVDLSSSPDKTRGGIWKNYRVGTDELVILSVGGHRTNPHARSARMLASLGSLQNAKARTNDGECQDGNSQWGCGFHATGFDLGSAASAGVLGFVRFRARKWPKAMTPASAEA
mgnify:CR=1 FL=1